MAERRAKDRGLKGTLSGTGMAFPKRSGTGRGFSVSLRQRRKPWLSVTVARGNTGHLVVRGHVLVASRLHLA